MPQGGVSFSRWVDRVAFRLGLPPALKKPQRFLLEDPGQRGGASSFRARWSVPGLWRRAPGNGQPVIEGPANLSVEILRNEKQAAREGLVSFLEGKEPSEILKCHGEDVLLWLLHHSPQYRSKYLFADHWPGIGPRERQGYNWLCRSIDGPEFKALSFETFSKMLDLYLFIHGEGLKTIPLADYLREMALPGMEISPKKMAEFELMPLKVGHYGNFDGSADGWWRCERPAGSGKYYDIFLDAPLAFALSFKGIPQAIVAFELVDEHTVKIRQIQGIRPFVVDEQKMKTFVPKISGIPPEQLPLKHQGGARGLVQLDWKRMMVALCAAVATRFDCRRVVLCSAKNSRWKDIRENGSSIYDETAHRLGFRRAGLSRDWRRGL